MSPLEPQPEIGDLWQHHKRHDEKCIILDVYGDQCSLLVKVFWLHATYIATITMLTIRTSYVRVASAEKSLDQK